MYGIVYVTLYLAVLIQYQQTDIQTQTYDHTIYRACIASCRKKHS